MGILSKILGPRSKYDKSLPYAYEAKVNILADTGKKPMYDHYFSETICGLIETLDSNDIEPAAVQIFGVYRQQQIPLELVYCLAVDGSWLNRPEICHSLEEHYRQTLEEHYKGHVEKGSCSYEDRDRRGKGPLW